MEEREVLSLPPSVFAAFDVIPVFDRVPLRTLPTSLAPQLKIRLDMGLVLVLGAGLLLLP